MTRQNAEPIDWSVELSANSDWLSRIVYARVRDHHAVEDVLQELGVAAVAWPATLCGPEAINRWLYAAAVKQALSFCRTRTRDQKKTKTFAQRKETDINELESDPLQFLIASENSEWLRLAMQNLSSRQREVLLLKHFDAWTCRQIAVKFGIAESTVKRHLVNARKQLRIELMRIRNES